MSYKEIFSDGYYAAEEGLERNIEHANQQVPALLSDYWYEGYDSFVKEKRVEGAKELKCRRIKCENKLGTLFYVHTQTGDFYCVSCARKINQFHPNLLRILD